MRNLILLALLLPAAMLGAQSPPHSIAPGMSRAQVVAALGAPITARATNGFEYLFYQNDCGRRCGMNDLIVLHADSVVDAIFRSRSRVYRGTSSSPAAIPPSAAASRKPVASPRPMRVPPAPNDTRPSIPLDAPATRPAPTSTPAKKTP